MHSKIVFLSALLALLGANLVASLNLKEEAEAKKEWKRLVSKVYSHDKKLRLNDILGYLKQADHLYKKLIKTGADADDEMVEVASQVSDLVGIKDFVGVSCAPETFKKIDTLLDEHQESNGHIVPYLESQYNKHFKECTIRYLDTVKNHVLELEPGTYRSGDQLWHSIAEVKDGESVTKFHRLVPQKTLLIGLKAYIESMTGPIDTADKKEFQEAFDKFVAQTCSEIDNVLEKPVSEFDVVVKSRLAAKEMDEFTSAWTDTELVCKTILSDKEKLFDLVYNFIKKQEIDADAPRNSPKFVRIFKKSLNKL